MRKMKAAELVLDFDLYPRNNVDSHHVKNLVDALASGEELPPVIIDKKSKRVIDGFHRVRAYLRLYGPDAEITVIERCYKSDAEMFLDAMRYNASHGAKLDPCDRTHCVIIGERLKIPLDAIAGALHVPADKLGELRNDRTAIGYDGLAIALKRTNHHFAGRKLSKRQQEANARSSGMSQVFYANQLIDLIESRMLDMQDDKLLERLQVLHGLLEALQITSHRAAE